MGRRDPWVWAVVLAGVACAREAPPPAAPPPVPVVTALAAVRDVPIEVRAVGTVEAGSTVEVRPQVGGVLTEVAFREGDDVRKGDLLFRIDPRPFAIALRQAEAALACDEAQLREAEGVAARATRLADEKFGSREERDRAVAQADALRAAVQADRAAIDGARLQLGYCTVRAPIDGRTGGLKVHAGNVVQANATALVTLLQVRPVRVAFPVPEPQLPAIRARLAEGGTPAVAASPRGDDGPPAAGTLSFLENAVDPATGTIRLKGLFPNDDLRLWPGQFATVTLTLGVRKGAVTVPAAAVLQGQKGPYAYVVRADATVEARPVATAPAPGGEAIVESGVAAGERVVVDGQSRLAPGTKVDPDARAPGEAAPRAAADARP